MKKTLSLLLSALLLCGTVTAASAWEENTDYKVLGEMNSANYPASTSTGLAEVTTGQLLKGTTFQSVANPDVNTPDMMFDGDAKTYYERVNRGWGGIILDQAYELTEVRVAPNPDLEKGALFNFWLQGSNDGENWVNIIIMRQDAHGNDYHIFTPQTVTDQRYIDAGYKASVDESIHWCGKGSYSMYRVVDGSVGEMELYGNPAPATETTPEAVSAMNVATPYYYGGNIHYRKRVDSIDGALAGTIIGAGGAWNKAVYDNVFDNNPKRAFDPPLEGPECWVGLKVDEPTALTEVRILPQKGGLYKMKHSYIQGSLDGMNWRTLAEITVEEVPAKQEWIIKPVTDTNGYTYFRYVSAVESQSTIADMLLFGAPAAAAEPFTVAPYVALHNKYDGPLYYAEAKNTVTGNELSGTPVCALGYYGWIDYGRGVEMAFDGSLDKESYYGTIPRFDGPQFWAGLKLDTPTAVGTVKVYRQVLEENFYFQGSLDGVNWVDLAVFTPDTVLEELTEDRGWMTATVTDETAYGYYRLFNSNEDHPSCGISFHEMKLYAVGVTPEGYAGAAETAAPETAAPETAAPETAAPETAAPETAAPETAAPETAAPETAAPETAAPETAAPETKAPETKAPETEAKETDAKETDAPKAEDPAESNNMGLIIGIAAAVVVVAVIAVVVIKKRK